MRVWPWSVFRQLRDDAEHAKRQWRELDERYHGAAVAWNDRVQEVIGQRDAAREARMQADAEVQRLTQLLQAANGEIQTLAAQREIHESAWRGVSEHNRTIERELGVWKGRAEGMRKALRVAETQLATVTAQLADLRREGFNPPAPIPDEREESNVVTPKVLEALRESMPEGSKVFRSMLASAADQLATGIPEPDVVKWIRDGADPDDFLT